MKKLFTLLSIAILGVCSNSFAQVVTSQDYETAVFPALPTGWTQTAAGTITASTWVGWKTGDSSALASTFFTLTGHTHFCAVNDDHDSISNNSNSLLKSASFSLTGITGAYVSFDMYYFASTYTGAGGGTESMTLEASTDGGSTWTVIQTIAGNTVSLWETRYISLATYNNANSLMLGFRYKDGGGWLYGAAIDNFKVFKPLNDDASAIGTAVPHIVPKFGANTDSVIYGAMNVGGNTITSLTAQYTINGGAPVSQTFTGLSIAPFTTSVLAFNTTLSGITATATQYALKVVITQVNGNADADPSNDTTTASFIGSNQAVTHNGLIEEFSSSTCSPCAALNATFDPLVVSNNINVPSTHVNLIRYQMNWPSPGNDVSYNPDGVTRRTYYGVNGIPDAFVNGASSNLNSGSTAAQCQAEIDGSHSDKSVMDISGTYNVNGTTHAITGTVSVTPYFTYSGSYKVHMAACERHYQNPGNTTGQLDYYRVMRKMFPDANGTSVASWTAGTAQNFNIASYAYSVGSVAQGNYNFWASPSGSDLVVFVQDNTTGEVIQSVVIPPTTTGVADMSGINSIGVYPNPASDFATVEFNMTESQNVQLIVSDVMGRIVYTTSQELGNGEQHITVPTTNLAAGIYNIKIQTTSGNQSLRLSVVK